MSREQFIKQIKSRGFETPSSDVVGFLQERQYQVAKAILVELAESSNGMVTDESVVDVSSRLFSKRNVYLISEKEQMAAANSQPIPEIRNIKGPSQDKQLKQGASKKIENSNSKPATNSENQPEEDMGPTDETVFAKRQSAKPVEFKGIAGPDSDDSSDKRMKIL